MAYTPTEWQSGDVVTSAKLNNIESGITSASGLCVYDGEESTLNKSYNDLLSMLNSGVIPFFVYNNFIYILGVIDPEDEGINFKQNTTSGNPFYFVMPDSDPDANLVAD